MVSEENFQIQIGQIANQLSATADALAADGMLVASGAVAAGVQTIKAMYTRLYPPVPAEVKATDPVPAASEPEAPKSEPLPSD